MWQPIVLGRIPGPLGLSEQEALTVGEKLHPIGISAPKFAADQLNILAVEFLSDHSVMLDHDSDWEDGGIVFDKPEWPVKPGDPQGHPVSHTMGKKIEVEVTVEYVGPKSRRALRGRLVGDDPAHGIHFEKTVRFHSGVQKIRLVSSAALAKKVKRLDLKIFWWIEGANITSFNLFSSSDVLAMPIVAYHEMFVTMSDPETVIEFPDITYRRMHHSVEKIESAVSIEPHKIVKHLMESYDRFELSNNPRNAWRLGEPGSQADCRTIVRYVINLLKMVGCPGNAECVLVYEKLSDSFPSKSSAKLEAGFRQLNHEPVAADFRVVAEPPPATGNRGGLDRPTLVHPNGRWSLVLFDSDGGPNAFEACLKFTHGTETKLHAAGVGEFAFPEQVIGVFSKLAWAVLADGTMIPAPSKSIKNYT